MNDDYIYGGYSDAALRAQRAGFLMDSERALARADRINVQLARREKLARIAKREDIIDKLWAHLEREADDTLRDYGVVHSVSEDDLDEIEISSKILAAKVADAIMDAQDAQS